MLRRGTLVIYLDFNGTIKNCAVLQRAKENRVHDWWDHPPPSPNPNPSTLTHKI